MKRWLYGKEILLLWIGVMLLLIIICAVILPGSVNCKAHIGAPGC